MKKIKIVGLRVNNFKPWAIRIRDKIVLKDREAFYNDKKIGYVSLIEGFVKNGEYSVVEYSNNYIIAEG